MRLTLVALAATVALAAPAAARRPLYRSPDGNTVTIELFNRGAATWAAGRRGSSGARTAYTTAVSRNDGFPFDLLVDTGAMGLCITQQEIDWMLSGLGHHHSRRRVDDGLAGECCRRVGLWRDQFGVGLRRGHCGTEAWETTLGMN